MEDKGDEDDKSKRTDKDEKGLEGANIGSISRVPQNL